MYRMREKSLAVSFCVALVGGSYLLAGQQPDHKRKYVNSACGFSIMLAEGQRIRLARAPEKRPPCSFNVLRDLESIWLSVHHGAFEEAAKDMRFFRDGDGWIIEGEGSAPAEKIETASWTGLVGSVAIRQYNENGYAGIGEETRALLFDRGDRVAEVLANYDSPDLRNSVHSFEFLPVPPQE
jgi:hypothetical protein